mgnify:CR=1 FL=1
MEVALAFGCVLFVGGVYELIRPKRRSEQQNFVVFHDSFGERHILNLDVNTSNNNLNQRISKNTKSYVCNSNIGICPISQEEIIPGDEVIELKCGHVFKKELAMIWLEHNNVCPLCRKNI